jgi:hypothetical protein
LCATVDRADTYVIALGDLASASAAIAAVLGRRREDGVSEPQADVAKL